MSAETCATCKEYGIKSYRRCCECHNTVHVMKAGCGHAYGGGTYCKSCWVKFVAAFLKHEKDRGYKLHSKESNFHLHHCPICVDENHSYDKC